MQLNGVPINFIISKVNKGLDLKISYDVKLKAVVHEGKMYKTWYFTFNINGKIIDINIPDVGDAKIKSAAVFLEHELWLKIREKPMPNEVSIKLVKSRDLDI